MTPYSSSADIVWNAKLAYAPKGASASSAPTRASKGMLVQSRSSGTSQSGKPHTCPGTRNATSDAMVFDQPWPVLHHAHVGPAVLEDPRYSPYRGLRQSTGTRRRTRLVADFVRRSSPEHRVRPLLTSFGTRSSPTRLRRFGERRRRGRDSNPRYPCEYFCFRDRPIRPLWHLSFQPP